MATYITLNRNSESLLLQSHKEELSETLEIAIMWNVGVTISLTKLADIPVE